MKERITMTVKLVAIAEDEKLDIVEFRFSTGLSTYTDSYIRATDEKREELYKEMRKTIDEFKALGIEIEYDFKNIKMF
jgi:hypothetical protein